MNAYLYKSNQLFLIFVIFLGGFSQAYATEKMDVNSMSLQQLKKQISYESEEEAIKTNAKLLKIIENTLGENSIKYAYHTQLQANFYSNLNNVKKTIELRQKADNLYKKITLGGKKFENSTTKTNLLLLRLIKMAD